MEIVGIIMLIIAAVLGLYELYMWANDESPLEDQ